MSRKTYNVVKSGEQWVGKLEGANRASVTGETKADVVQKTVDLAKKAPLSQVKIHGENGRIQSERTYGKDPEKYKG